MIRVQGSDQPGGLPDPLCESLLVLLAEGAGFVSDLPGEDGGIVGIFQSGVSVRASDDEAHVIGEEFPGLCVGDEPADILRVGAISGHGGDWDLSGAAPGEVLGVSARPLPGVVQIEDGFHAAFAELPQEEVESVEQVVVVFSGGILERGFDFGGDARFAVGSDQNAQVRDSAVGQSVEFACESFAVAVPARRAEDRAVPEVRTDEVIGFSVEDELSVFDTDERVGLGCGRAAADEQGSQQEEFG